MLQGARWYLQSTAGERIEQQPLVTITLPAEKAIWEKKGKELNIDGRLFDVKSYTPSAETLTVTGVYDEEELNLVRLLSDLTAPEQNDAFLHFLLVLQCFSASLFFFLPGAIRQNKIVHRAVFYLSLPHPFCQAAEQPPPSRMVFLSDQFSGNR